MRLHSYVTRDFRIIYTAKRFHFLAGNLFLYHYGRTISLYILPLPPKYIRLLKIIPSTLETFPLDTSPNFYCLSYAWGSHSTTTSLEISGQKPSNYPAPKGCAPNTIPTSPQSEPSHLGRRNMHQPV
jgi:hypothetical protein